MKKNQFEYTRVLKLPPAIGDWTTIQYQDTDEDVNISPVVNINFDSFPKEDLREAHLIHYHFADQMVSKLSKDMNIKIELNTVSATQMSYGDFLDSQDQKVVQSDLVLPGVGRVNTILDWGLADMMVDRLTGGKGDIQETESFSEIELHILYGQIQNLVPHYAYAWDNLFTPQEVAMEFVAGKYRRDRKITLREAYVLFTFYINFGKGATQKMICAYPNVVLRRLLSQKRARNVAKPKRVSFSAKTQKALKFDLSAVLGKANLTMGELRRLQVGDVVPLDTTLETPVEVDIQGTTIYAQPGIHNRKLCAQVIFWDGVSEPTSLVQHEAAGVSPLAQTSLVEAVAPIDDTYTGFEAPAAPMGLVGDDPLDAVFDQPEPTIQAQEPVLDEINEVDNYSEIDDDFQESYESDVLQNDAATSFEGAFDAQPEIAQVDPVASTEAQAPAESIDNDFDDGFDDDDDYSWDDLEDDF